MKGNMSSIFDTESLLECPDWLTSDKLDEDTLVHWFWERHDTVTVAPDSRTLVTHSVWEIFKLVAIGTHGLYEFNSDGLCVRARSIHPINP